MKKKRKIRADILIIAAFLAVGAVLALCLLFGAKKGNVVQVRVDGEIVKEFSLSENTSYEIQGVNNGRNLLRIEDGKAEVTEASCPDGLCINMGQIDKVGQSIVCLPNKVVVEIVAGDESQELEIDYVVG